MANDNVGESPTRQGDAGAAAAPSINPGSTLPLERRTATLVKRVDNFFYNTKDVAALAGYYSDVLGMKIRREQVLTPGLMWMEINVGGMELSFRQAEGTPKEHPDLKDDFLELSPGRGATISFEVSDTQRVRKDLQDRGVKFHGDVIHCTDGKELISIFEDPFGRPVQLYEPKFSSVHEGEALASRGTGTPMEDTFSNLRDIRDVAMSISFNVDDLDLAKRFYGETLELPLQGEDDDHVSFVLDRTVIEFRSHKSPSIAALGIPQLTASEGGSIAIEVRELDVARSALEQRNFNLGPLVDFSLSRTALNGAAEEGNENVLMQRFSPHGILGNGRLCALRDPDGNPVELWERHTQS